MLQRLEPNRIQCHTCQYSTAEMVGRFKKKRKEKSIITTRKKQVEKEKLNFKGNNYVICGEGRESENLLTHIETRT